MFPGGPVADEAEGIFVVEPIPVKMAEPVGQALVRFEPTDSLNFPMSQACISGISAPPAEVLYFGEAASG